MENDYFDTEIIFHGQKNMRKDDHLRNVKDLLDKV